MHLFCKTNSLLNSIIATACVALIACTPSSGDVNHTYAQRLENVLKTESFKLSKPSTITVNHFTENTEDKAIGYIPYEIKVVNVDEVGIINKFTDFFAYQDIDIESLDSELYSSKYGANLLKLNIKVKIPGNLNIVSLREQFDIMCYDESFDATFKVSSISS